MKEINEYDKDVRKEHRTNLKAYAGFLSVTVIAIITKSNSIENLWAILTLLAISIPSAIGSINIERLTEYGRSSNSKNLCLISMILIYIPSILAISILIGTASVIAGATFAITSIAWFVFIIKFRHVI